MIFSNARNLISKSVRMSFFLMMLFPVLSKAEGTDITTEEYVKCIYASTSKVWPEIEKVWNTLAYRNIRLIVADSHDAWAIDSKNLIKIPYSEIQQRHLAVEYLHYQEIQWPDGRPTIYVSLGPSLPEEEVSRYRSGKKPVPLLFTVATHEAFHFFVQADTWKRRQQNISSRATEYPVQPNPRFYRNNIIRALYASMEGDPRGLSHARYWSNLWKEQYHNEEIRIRQTDVDEGSAKYIEVAAEIIAQGVTFGTPEFYHAVLDKVREDVNIIYTSPDSESYIIGALSGFILNTRKVEWQSYVEKGTPPLDVLLENIKPIKESADLKLKKEINEYIEKINGNSKIENFVKAFEYRDSIRIFIDSDLFGTYSFNDTGGFFWTKSIPYDLVVGVTSSANWPGGSINIKDGIAIQINGEHPEFYGRRGFMVIYSGRIPPPNNGRLILKTNTLSLDITYPKEISKTKTIYLP
ncbi:hypothetical protein I5O28_03430 [Serratia marcescens]|nr:hypothetical protein [Serratia marcescens]MBH3201193.1 hypothetical protein [Serratia marcescens]MBH3333191.1 hypothetical protein [Serratia marcescens]HEJ6927242.1 hypothetical protein [Serratia marcescens]HEJ7074690.1 hypothetical protein [Serratia marcescens]